MVPGRAVFGTVLFRMDLGSGHAPCKLRHFCKPRCPARSMAADLRDRVRADSYAPVPVQKESGAGVYGYDRGLRFSGIHDVSDYGDCHRRTEMVGLQRILPESKRQNLRGGASGIRHRRTGDHLCHRADGGQPCEQG